MSQLNQLSNQIHKNDNDCLGDIKNAELNLNVGKFEQHYLKAEIDDDCNMNWNESQNHQDLASMQYENLHDDENQGESASYSQNIPVYYQKTLVNFELDRKVKLEYGDTSNDSFQSIVERAENTETKEIKEESVQDNEQCMKAVKSELCDSDIEADDIQKTEGMYETLVV